LGKWRESKILTNLHLMAEEYDELSKKLKPIILGTKP